VPLTKTYPTVMLGQPGCCEGRNTGPKQLLQNRDPHGWVQMVVGVRKISIGAV